MAEIRVLKRTLRARPLMESNDSKSQRFIKLHSKYLYRVWDDEEDEEKGGSQ